MMEIDRIKAMEAVTASLQKLVTSLAVEVTRLQAMHDSPPKQARRFYTVKETCDALRVGRTTLHDMVNRGQLRKIKRGAKVLFLAIEVDGIIAKEERSKN